MRLAIRIKGGEKEETVAFAPYRARVKLRRELVLEVQFARRNTFGPLHQAYPQSCYGPENFLIGEDRRVDFVPAPQGLC